MVVDQSPLTNAICRAYWDSLLGQDEPHDGRERQLRATVAFKAIEATEDPWFTWSAAAPQRLQPRDFEWRAFQMIDADDVD